MSFVTADGDYADRQLVDEATHRSLLLCRSALASPATPAGVRVSCLARVAMLLDALPLARLPADGARRLGRDRCQAYSELAAACRQTGDAHGAVANYRRAATLAQALGADALLGQICAAWADVEESLGRPTEARRVRARATAAHQQTMRDGGTHSS
ncbi:hypothetical protein H4R21_006177 [Coemansia helicoidea]|uniref:Uncharacterized protein n=1 Tax=Coemansia helicoidea TaxID=1286919 RepID=A0ACC1KNJ6_9FUNG|nr:hypothetical protein H4R21_006177 [Coemansia helicoidea]